MFSIKDFHAIKDHLPIIYLGHDEISAAKLVILVGQLRETTKKQFFLVFKERFANDFKYDFVINEKVFNKISNYFNRSCICGENGENTIRDFILENKIDPKIRCQKAKKGSKIYYFGKQEDFEKDLNSKLNIQITNDINICLNNAKLVYGRESIVLLILAFAGVPVSLCTENIKNSFQMLFPQANLCNK